VGLIVIIGTLVLSLAVAVGGAAWVLSGVIRLLRARAAMVLLTLAVMPTLLATTPNFADPTIERFLTRQEPPHPYRAARRLEAETGTRQGWLEATTEYSATNGFRYQITAEGGSSQIRSRVLKAVLEGEQSIIAKGEAGRAALAPDNYTFQPNGVDAEGFATVLLSPRRKDRSLLSGVMFLRADEGELVRLQGRLAKNPSFWVRDVDIVRNYSRIQGTVVPVALESKAHVRFLGPATFRMTYRYLEIDGQAVRP
jgi:hypothetical protein